MKKLIVLQFILMQTSGWVYSQTGSDVEMSNWIEENHILLNHPSPPDSFVLQYDCEKRAMYRRDSGDTIFLYSWGGSFTFDLEELKTMVTKPTFNVYYIPIKVQSNGTLITHVMQLNTFLIRQDTLYLYDSYNEVKEEAKMAILAEYWRELITEGEKERRINAVENEIDDFVPKFKAVYFKGIFDSEPSYTFNEDENFKKEEVHLISRYTINDQNYFEINLKTWTNGKMRFSEDFKVLQTSLCDIY